MNTGLYLSEMHESLNASGGTVRKELKAFQRSNESLPKQSAALETRKEELEADSHTAIHKLKSPLSVIITTSNAIFNITDLTPEELYEYLKQIRSNAHKMDEIIDNILLCSEV